MIHWTWSRFMLKVVMIGGRARLTVALFMMTMKAFSMTVTAIHHL